MSLIDKIKQSPIFSGIIASSLAPMSADAQTPQSDNTPEKYKKNITVRNDSVRMVGSTAAYYNPEEQQIYIPKGDISWKDFGFKNAPKETDSALLFIHEQQHYINRAQKNIGESNMSLNEDYQRNVHDEITALIAEKLEIRRQYREAQTPEEKAAVLDKYASTPEHKDFIAAIKSGQINPDSSQSADFEAEMAFIKNDATAYRADPNDDAYRQNWTQLSIEYLNRAGENIKPNPETFHREIHEMYQIGGIDFTQYGMHNDFVIENQTITTADNFLQQGGDPKKIATFINDGEGEFRHAETLDVSGLSREQAEKVLQTAIVTQYLSENISADICLNDLHSYDFNFISRNLQDKTALYLDMKSDIWEKNNTLSAEGNPEKFASLMEQAQTIQLDPESWFKTMGSVIRRDIYDIDEVKKRVAETQGKTINITDVITNMDEFTLPLEGTSKEDVLERKAQKDKEHADFLTEYYSQEPPSSPRLSEPYEVSIMDLQSSVLSDELAARKKVEERPLTIEALHQSHPRRFLSDRREFHLLSGGENYQNAELRETRTSADKTTTMTLLDGKIHGAVLTQDKDGNITNCELYNHGEKIDTDQHQMKIIKNENNGITHLCIILDGNKFGAELVTTPDNHTKIAFYDISGQPINGTPGATIKHNKIRQTRSETVSNNSSFSSPQNKAELQSPAPKVATGTEKKQRQDAIRNMRFGINANQKGSTDSSAHSKAARTQTETNTETFNAIRAKITKGRN